MPLDEIAGFFIHGTVRYRASLSPNLAGILNLDLRIPQVTSDLSKSIGFQDTIPEVSYKVLVPDMQCSLKEVLF